MDFQEKNYIHGRRRDIGLDNTRMLITCSLSVCSDRISC